MVYHRTYTNSDRRITLKILEAGRKYQHGINSYSGECEEDSKMDSANSNIDSIIIGVAI